MHVFVLEMQTKATQSALQTLLTPEYRGDALSLIRRQETGARLGEEGGRGVAEMVGFFSISWVNQSLPQFHRKISHSQKKIHSWVHSGSRTRQACPAAPHKACRSSL